MSLNRVSVCVKFGLEEEHTKYKKGEVSPGILCRLGEWRMILETKQQKFGQI